MFNSPIKIRDFLKLPSGAGAGSMDPIQLLLVWAKEYQSRDEDRPVSIVGLGKPNAPVPPIIPLASLEYWNHLYEEAEATEAAFQGSLSLTSSSSSNIMEPTFQAPSNLTNSTHSSNGENKSTFDTFNYTIAEANRQNARLFEKSQEKMAEGFRKFYSTYPGLHPHEIKINAEHIIPTLGGGGALNCIFRERARNCPNGLVAVQEPFYTLYTGSPQRKNKLITFQDLIPTPQNLSDFTTRRSLKDAFTEADARGEEISIVLLCNPNNPTGKVYSEEEWEAFIEIVKDKPCKLGIDEAYAEIDFSGQPLLLAVIYKNLALINQMLPSEEKESKKTKYENILNRVIVLRSGTKAFSISGERHAVVIVPNEALRNEIKKEAAYMGFPPRACEIAYAAAVSEFDIPFWDQNREFLVEFYKKQVRYVEERLAKLGVAVLDCNGIPESVEGTFYVRANFNRFIGYEVRDEVTRKCLREIGLNGERLNTDVDIAFFFLITKRIMLTPLSFFGENETKGVLRITCSEGKALLDSVLDKMRDLLEELDNPQEKARAMDVAKPGTEHTFSVMKDAPAAPVKKPLRMNSLFSVPAPTQQEEGEFITPDRNYIQWMVQYWKIRHEKAISVQKLRQQHANNALNLLKNTIKSCFMDILEKTIHELISPKSATMTFPKWMTIARKKELHERIADMTQYVRCLYPNLYPNSEVFKVMDRIPQRTPPLDPEPVEYLEKIIEAFIVSNINNLDSTADLIPLIAHLTFEKIYCDTMVDLTHDTFSEVFSEYFYENRNEVQETFTLIRDIVAKRPSVDYTHPQGDENARAIVAEQLGLWYDQRFNLDHVLFASVDPASLIKDVFRDQVIFLNLEMNLYDKPLKPTNQKTALYLRNQSECKGGSLSKDSLEKISKIVIENLMKNPQRFVVIDESHIEKCFQDIEPFGKNSLLNLLEKKGIPLERMVLIRSAMGLFPFTREHVSVLVTKNIELMGRLLEEGINMQGHSPRSSQYSYSNGLATFMKRMSDIEYRTKFIQYIAWFSRFYLAIDLHNIFEQKKNAPKILRTRTNVEEEDLNKRENMKGEYEEMADFCLQTSTSTRQQLFTQVKDFINKSKTFTSKSDSSVHRPEYSRETFKRTTYDGHAPRLSSTDDCLPSRPLSASQHLRKHMLTHYETQKRLRSELELDYRTKILHDGLNHILR